MKYSFLSFLISTILQIWLLTACNLAFAQAQPGRWVDDLYLVKVYPGSSLDYNVFVDEKNSIHKKIPNVIDSAEFSDFPLSRDYFECSRVFTYG